VLVDWFTVIAQIVNFLILVALLKHFLYDRIIRAMDNREQKIQSTLEEAENKRKEADNEAESYRRKNEEVKEKRDQMLAEAREEADRRLKELTRDAREQVDQSRLRWQESLEKEKSAFLQDLKQLAAREVYALSRKALKDMAEADLEERMAEVFVSRLKELKMEDKDALMQAIEEEENKAVVRSGFEISTAGRQKITKALREEIAESAEITYDTDPDMIMGVELKVRGEKIVWTIREYLMELEERAKSAIENETRKGERAKPPGAGEADTETSEKEEGRETEEEEAEEGQEEAEQEEERTEEDEPETKGMEEAEKRGESDATAETDKRKQRRKKRKRK
jgi:F-type H+-transporting ATPase subunit b